MLDRTNTECKFHTQPNFQGEPSLCRPYVDLDEVLKWLRDCGPALWNKVYPSMEKSSVANPHKTCRAVADAMEEKFRGRS